MQALRGRPDRLHGTDMGMVYVDAEVSRDEQPGRPVRFLVDSGSGPPDDEALLGTLTLEPMGLVLDPFNRTLRPLRARLAMLSAA